MTSCTGLLFVLHNLAKWFAFPHLRYIFPIAGHEEGHFCHMIVFVPWKLCWKIFFCTAAPHLCYEPLGCLTPLTWIVLSTVHMFSEFQYLWQVIDLCLRLSPFPPILWEFVPNQILSLIFSSGSLKGQPLASSFKSVTNCSIVSALPWTGVVKIISGKHWVRFWFKVASNRSK